MLRNVSGQKVSVFAFDYSTGAPKTGDGANITVYVSKDDGTVTALTDTSATEKDSTNAKGWYDFDLSATETNAVKLLFTGKSSTSNVSVVGQCIYTMPATSFEAATTIAKLDTMLQVAAGSPTDYAFSNDALRNVPLLVLNEIADAVWNRTVAGRTSAGTFGLALALAQEFASRLATTLESASGSPNEFRFSKDALRHVTSMVWDAERSLFTVSGSFGAAIDATMSSRASAANLALLDAKVVLVKGTTDKMETLLTPAGAGSPADYAFSPDAFRYFSFHPLWETTEGQAVKTAAATTLLYLDASVSSRASASTVATIAVVTNKLDTTLEVTAGSPGDYQFTADSLRNAPAGSGGGGGGPSAGDIANAVWDEVVSGHLVSGTFGLFAYNVASVSAKLDTLLEASGSPSDYRFTDEALAKAENVVLNAQLANHASGGSVGEAIQQSDLRGRRTVLRGTVGNATTPSVTQFTPSALDVAGASVDQFKGRVIVFDKDTVTAALRGEATDITASSAATLPLFTYSTLSAAPASGDTFSIV